MLPDCNSSGLRCWLSQVYFYHALGTRGLASEILLRPWSKDSASAMRSILRKLWAGELRRLSQTHRPQLPVKSPDELAISLLRMSQALMS